jgi:hypothetical protein
MVHLYFTFIFNLSYQTKFILIYSVGGVKGGSSLVALN